jgi:hypothetical protein
LRAKDREFELFHVSTIEMQVGIKTVSLPRPKFEKDVQAMGLIEFRQAKVSEKNYC